MRYLKIDTERLDDMIALHLRYKADIGEEAPSEADIDSLRRAVEAGRICFFGAECGGELVGCCSVCVTYSTFNYAASGVFEDFYIVPEYRHRGIARALANFAYKESGVSSMTVGCAGCDADMYRALGFDIPLGSMLSMVK